MLEKVLKGSFKYYAWLAFLLLIIGVGATVYLGQLIFGMQVTGLTRDVSWGFYISQFTYLVGVAASAVMLVLPAYFHHYKEFKRMIIFGEFLAIGAVIMCVLFIVVDIGQPQKAMNVILHASPQSVMFWDMMVLSGYLVLNAIIGWVTLEAERHDVEPPKWVKPLIYLSVFWAFGIHTVTAFLYAGIPGRYYWLTAIMAARFLASAFCSGPAILLLLMLLVKKLTGFDPGKKAIKTLTLIITYAMALNVFFYCLELFTAFYSGTPSHYAPIQFLFMGYDGQGAWINGWMWLAVVFAFGSLALLMLPSTRNNEKLLPYTLIALVIASWIDKGLGLLIGGLSPNPFKGFSIYTPSLVEILVSLGIFAIGALVVSILWKIALEVKKEANTFEYVEK